MLKYTSISVVILGSDATYLLEQISGMSHSFYQILRAFSVLRTLVSVDGTVTAARAHFRR